MRLILLILLLCSFGADAQMIIKAHPNYVPFRAFKGLLDDYSSAAAAYSLRKLDKDYTGAAIRVRKDTTGQPEQDIGFTSNGDLDTAFLKSFILNNSAFVTTWYSQGDSASIDFIQSTQTNQPRIALNGVIDRLLGKPAIRFDGSNDFMTITSSQSKFEFLHRSGLSSVFLIAQIRSGAFSYVIYNNNNTSSNFIGVALFATPTNSITSHITRGVISTLVSNNVTANNFTITNNLFLITNELDNANATAANRNKLYYNDGNAITNNVNNSIASTTINSGQNMTLGRTSSSGTSIFSGSMTELIFFKGDKTSDRIGIRNAINTYYGIY